MDPSPSLGIPHPSFVQMAVGTPSSRGVFLSSLLNMEWMSWVLLAEALYLDSLAC